MKKLFPLAAALLFLALLLEPSAAAEAARNGLALSFQTAIPALFPFFIAGSLLVDSGLAAVLGCLIARPLSFLCGVRSGAAAFLLGLAGGYPVGARTVCDLYKAGDLSRADAEKLLGFCNNTGPAFILGVAGLGVCGSVHTGMVLYLIHAVSALLTGILLRRPAPPTPVISSRAPSRPSPAAAFVEAMQGGFSTALLVAAFVTGFSVLIGLLQEFGLFSLLTHLLAPLLNWLRLPEGIVPAALAGSLELTNGLMQLPALHLRRQILLPLTSFLLAFGGVSVHCQTLALTEAAGLHSRLHTPGKLLHGVLSALLTSLLLHAAPQTLPVFAPAFYAPKAPFPIAMIVVAGIVLVLLIKNTGKQRQNRV